MKAKRWQLATLALLVIVAGCPRVDEVVVHRSNCLVCHTPLDGDGTPHGIEDAHPWLPLDCTTCHGGNAYICDGELGEEDGEPTCDGTWIYDQKQAHVSPGDGPAFIKNLSGELLDQIDPAYIRFINPGDFRVVDQTCAPCHKKETEMAMNSTMAHTAGEVAVARYRAGKQEEPYGIVAAVERVDPNPPDNPCAVAELSRFDPPHIDLDSTDPENMPSVANLQDQYMVKSCFRCHLNDFGANQFAGDFRSSGCTACHMPYSVNGLSKSKDPWVNKQTVPHPEIHELTTSPPIEACTKCHYRGGRLGISYQGYREGAGYGYNPEHPDVLGFAQHGHDANFYVTDEDITNAWDETPADVHFEAGMHCVDCHTLKDVHGDGHLYADTQCAVETSCEDCHGDARGRAVPTPDRDNVYEADGKLWLHTKITDLVLEVPQVIDAVTPGHPRYTFAAEQSMGIHADGTSHTDQMECYTCHAGWLPSCYGCHVKIDMSKSKKYHTTGEEVPGRPSGSRRWVALNDLVLMMNTEGKMAPSMPAERFFMTLVMDDPDGSTTEHGKPEEKVLFKSQPRSFTFDDGRTIAGFGQRTFNPHTTRKRSQFMACDRCHSVGDPSAPDNAALLDLTHGFGTERFLQAGCDVTNDDPSCDEATDFTLYPLDAIQTREGQPLVVVGHPDPTPSRVLTLEEIGRMRNVQVPLDAQIQTEIPADAITDVNWPYNQPLDD